MKDNKMTTDTLDNIATFFDDTILIDEDAVNQIMTNNTAFPGIDRVIYNIGKKAYRKLDENGKSIPVIDPATNKQKLDSNGKKVFKMTDPIDVLATVVYFDDATKISVVNSTADGVHFTEHTLSDGTTVRTATRESKEMGLVYAIVKRLLAKFNDKGEAVESSTGRVLNDLVRNAYDTAIERAELKIARAKSKAAHEAKFGTAKPKKRYSIHETLERINGLLDNVETESKDNILLKLAQLIKQ